MALKTNLEMAEIYQAAILAITVGGYQSYSIGEGPESKTVSRANLADLERMFEKYMAKARIEARGTTVGVTYPIF